jgi:hypothetical protein
MRPSYGREGWGRGGVVAGKKRRGAPTNPPLARKRAHTHASPTGKNENRAGYRRALTSLSLSLSSAGIKAGCPRSNFRARPRRPAPAPPPLSAGAAAQNAWRHERRGAAKGGGRRGGGWKRRGRGPKRRTSAFRRTGGESGRGGGIAATESGGWWGLALRCVCRGVVSGAERRPFSLAGQAPSFRGIARGKIMKAARVRKQGWGE